MDAPDLRPKVSDPNAKEVDPIGLPVLPKLPKFLARSLALSGVALGTALAVGNGTVNPTWTISY
jgi:hypothetical protein